MVLNFIEFVIKLVVNISPNFDHSKRLSLRIVLIKVE